MSKLYVDEIAPKTTGGTITTTGFGNNVKEVLTMLCDGGAYTVSSGTYTSTNVNAVQNLTTTYTDVNGSVISYTPPTGTTAVVYEFTCQIARDGDAHSIGSYRFFIDGVEVVYNRHSVSANSSPEIVTTFKYVIPIGGTENTNTGRQANWSAAKTLKIQAREHGSSNEVKLFGTYYFDGATATLFSTPILTITALGG